VKLKKLRKKINKGWRKTKMKTAEQSG